MVTCPQVLRIRTLTSLGDVLPTTRFIMYLLRTSTERVQRRTSPTGVNVMGMAKKKKKISEKK